MSSKLPAASAHSAEPSEAAGTGPAALRRLGSSDLLVSSVGFGCWPIAGVSSLDVNDRDSLATIHAALDAGINFIDTAYSYGYSGEADRLLAQALSGRRERVVLASKVGAYYSSHRQRIVDGRAETILAHAQQAVQRLGVEYLDILYLHQPDPAVPIAESAGAMARVVEQGIARYAGVSNVDARQLREFHAVCPVVVVQPPFNMFQPEHVMELREFCSAHHIAMACYWVLMKGLLAGKLARNHQFAPNDRRLTYPVYQGQAWERAQDLLDKLRPLAAELDCSVAQLVIAWTLRQPAVTVALCGAKRASQIQETAAAMHIELAPETLLRINGWLSCL